MSTPATTERLAALLAEHVYEPEFLGGLKEVWTTCLCGEQIDATFGEGRMSAEVFKANWSDHLASVLADAGVGFVADAWREAAEEVGDWEFPLDPDASKDAIAARVVLLERLSRLVYRLRERADRIGGAS